MRSKLMIYRVAMLVLLAVICIPAMAQSYPARPVRLLVGTNAGGGIDIVARLLAANLQDQFKNPVIVENRPGASGAIAAEYVKSAAPDGDTLLCGFSAQMVMNAVVLANISYDPERDFEPVSMLGLFPVVLVSNPALPVHSILDLISYAKARPGKLNYASGSSGFFFVSEYFKQLTGTDIRSIPFTGSASAVSAVLAGTVDIAFVDFPPAIAQVRAGRLTALGVTTAQRVPSLPDVPAVAESVPDYEFVHWTGIFAPARTPKDIVARLQQEIARAVATPQMKEKMLFAGVVPATLTPQALGDTLRKDLERIRRLARSTGSMGK